MKDSCEDQDISSRDILKEVDSQGGGITKTRQEISYWTQ